MQKIAWGITGAGHLLEETIKLMEAISNEYEIDVYLSRAAEEVLVQYDLHQRVNAMNVYRDKVASIHLLGKFYHHEYSALVLAPATSNTVAKCVVGIADNLVTNIFAHAGKNRITTVVLPCDTVEETITSKAPGETVEVQSRKIDLENNQKLTSIEGVHVVLTPGELARWLQRLNL